MRRAGLLLALAALILTPQLAHAQGGALLQKPITAGNCATFVLPNIVADSGVACNNHQVTISDGVHGSILLAPTNIILPNSPAILNTTPGQPLLMTRGTATTGTDGVDIDIRRYANYSGGTFGFVNAAVRVYGEISAGTNSFEWPFLCVLQNSATAADNSQNSCGYFQAHKNGGGGTWALTAELLDHQANPASPSVTFEYDMQVKGTDTGHNRVIQDLWGKTDDGNAAVVSFAQRFNTDSQTTFTNGLTTDGATISNAAIGIGAGQKLCLDGITCANYVTQSSGTTTLVNGGVTAFTASSIGSNVIALNSSGQITAPSGQKICLDGVTCANYLTQASGTVSLFAGGVLSTAFSSLGTNTIALNSSGQVTLPSAAKLCLDATTCANYLTQSGGTTNLVAGGVLSTSFSSIGTNTIALNSTGQITLPTNAKLCLDGSGCGNYALYDGTTITFYRSGTARMSVGMSTGVVTAWGGFSNAFNSGVTCSGAPTAAFASSGGIVTHC